MASILKFLQVRFRSATKGLKRMLAHHIHILGVFLRVLHHMTYIRNLQRHLEHLKNASTANGQTKSYVIRELASGRDYTFRVQPIKKVGDTLCYILTFDYFHSVIIYNSRKFSIYNISICSANCSPR